MGSGFSEERGQVRAAVRAYLADHFPFETRRQLARSEPGWNPAHWDDLARRLGLTGLLVPASAGGAGAGPLDMIAVVEEMGERMLLAPFAETAVLAAVLLDRSGGQGDALRAIAEGDARYAFAWSEPSARYNLANIGLRAEQRDGRWILNGLKSVVTSAPWATHLLVLARTRGAPGDENGLSLFAVDPGAAGVRMTTFATIDGARAADIAFAGVEVGAGALVGQEGAAFPVAEEAADYGRVALCAESLGVMRRLVGDTFTYLQDRRQFGQPLAGFQALQHRLVDMYLQLELAAAAARRGAGALDLEPGERAKAVSAAKVTVGQALRFVGQNAVQLHGGMGMTEELPIGHYFRRATVIESELGSSDYHLARYARLARAA